VVSLKHSQQSVYDIPKVTPIVGGLDVSTPTVAQNPISSIEYPTVSPTVNVIAETMYSSLVKQSFII
jgi:hypothetical protein